MSDQADKEKKKQRIDKGFFETWLPQVLWWPLACIGAFASASLAYGGTAAAFALLGGTHIFLPLICSAWALIKAYFYLMEHGSDLHKGLTDIGRHLDNPGGSITFMKKYAGVLAMFAIAIGVGLFFAYPPAALMAALGPQGAVATFLGFHAMTAPVYGGVVAFMTFIIESFLTPILQGLYCRAKMMIGPRLGYKEEEITCSATFARIPVTGQSTPQPSVDKSPKLVAKEVADEIKKMGEQEAVSLPLHRVISADSLSKEKQNLLPKLDFRLLQQVVRTAKKQGKPSHQGPQTAAVGPAPRSPALTKKSR